MAAIPLSRSPLSKTYMSNPNVRQAIIRTAVPTTTHPLSAPATASRAWRAIAGALCLFGTRAPARRPIPACPETLRRPAAVSTRLRRLRVPLAEDLLRWPGERPMPIDSDRQGHVFSKHDGARFPEFRRTQQRNHQLHHACSPKALAIIFDNSCSRAPIRMTAARLR
jgi:hypothetical protein